MTMRELNEDNMRKIVVDAIEDLRNSPCGFHEQDTMRWNRWWLNPLDGVRFFYSKKEQKKSAPDAIRLSNTTRNDFELLDNENLLACYTLLTRQASKQM